MNGFRITVSQPSVVNIEQAHGETLSLKAGAVIKAKVLGSPGPGTLTLSIGDVVLTANTKVPLAKNALVYFKVLESNSGESGQEVRLQFAGYQSQPAKPSSEISSDELFEKAARLAAGAEDASEDFPDVVKQLLKALPRDISLLSRQDRIQLLDLLKSSLQLAGRNIQDNINVILQNLKDTSAAGTETTRVLNGLLVQMQKLSHSALKDAMENSGVLLETKLKLDSEDSRTTASGLNAGANTKSTSAHRSGNTETSDNFDQDELTCFHDSDFSQDVSRKPSPTAFLPKLAEKLARLTGSPLSNPIQLGSQTGGTQNQAPFEEVRYTPPKTTAENTGQQRPTATTQQQIESTQTYQKDLKALLAGLRQMLQQESFDHNNKLERDLALTKGDVSQKIFHQELLNAVDGVLRDIETFQLLSKMTDSFYTFLPVIWDELKDGDIAFKRTRSRGTRDSFYCLVNLNLKGFGGLMIMVLMQQKEFFVSFKTDNSPLQSLIASHLDELQQMFEESDIRLKSVNVLNSDDRSLDRFENFDDFDNIISIKI